MLQGVDDAFACAIRTEIPGILCILIGAIFSFRKALARHTSRWGIRLSALGLSLASLVPGILILVETIRGRLLWPAAIASVSAIAVGLVFLAILRQNWAPRATDSN
jgi:hypothetical protein